MSHINLHSTLLESTENLCEKIRIAKTSTLQNVALVELIFLIARYQEEGVKLYPKVYLTSDIDSALKMLPGQASIKIGSSNCFYEAVKSSLKKCAPLANSGWCIYVSYNINKLDIVEYGIFRGDTNPTAVNIDTIILTDDLPFISIKIHQIATDNVEVRSSDGNVLNISLSHTANIATTPLVEFEQLVDKIVSNVESNKGQVVNYLSRILIDSIKKSHGCLIAVSNSNDIPHSLSSDGTYLPDPIDFQSLVKFSMEEKKEIGNLISMGRLLEGMLNSDGIVIFDQNARLIAFNCFVRLPDQEQAINTVTLGGARTRAYDALCHLLGTDLEGVYMQSQDGWTQFKGATHE